MGSRLQAGCLDELVLDIVPVVLRSGERIFEDVAELTAEPVEVANSPLATHIVYRITQRAPSPQTSEYLGPHRARAPLAAGSRDRLRRQPPDELRPTGMTLALQGRGKWPQEYASAADRRATDSPCHYRASHLQGRGARPLLL